jgi:hypothetical protein
MRKWLEGIALLALGLDIAFTVLAVAGPAPLPGRIPIHFDLKGHPNAWGSTAMILLLPGVTIFIYLLLTVVTRFPGESGAGPYGVAESGGRYAPYVVPVDDD